MKKGLTIWNVMTVLAGNYSKKHIHIGMKLIRQQKNDKTMYIT